MTSRFPTVAPKRPRGRPAKGLRPGELVTNYERVTVRMPAASKARLMAPADVRELAGKVAKRELASYQDDRR